ncbi:prominin-1-A-like isoform X2 [Ruditapes philippinarum]|uniref:prominin-1-A-like isoform X2 n=1 Tax=Ruditapes philippinarum TaxID=129788 RepID=UPI00295B3689|nr:prominin-1-A-like isoform X2 [Ruditapes philippinarum]XP_060587690.1 prominin-1-A-like isoform X2 [Ruditapes philippinarum]XP_060587696.1 prominin-1-A-like isoform X2 [Ruditapes philippinarum]
MTFIKSVFFFALVASCLSEDAQIQNKTITDTSSKDSTDEDSALQKGMSPIFDMYHNFLDVVMSQNFYDAKSAAFNVHTLINITKNNDYGQIQSKWQDLVSTFGGYAGCIIVGLLFIVFMPIVGMIYCCCHCCCNKCGGTKEMMDPPRASCKRWTYTVLLLIFATLMLAGGIVTFLGSELLHKSLRNDDGKGLVGKMDDSLGHLEKFTSDTINDIVHEAREKIINTGLPKIFSHIKDAANTTVKKVKDSINATDLLMKAGNLGNAATEVLDGLKEVNKQVTKLKGLQNTVSTTLTITRNKLSGVPGEDKVDSLKFQPNFTALNTQDQRISNLTNAVNISSLVDKAEKEFDNVSKEVDKNVEAEINKAQTQVDDMNRTISKNIGEINDTTQPFLKSVNEGRTFANDETDTFKQMADYIWYSCIGLGCAVILVVFFYYMGVLFGLCGERPGPRAACCNRETGAHLLCTGICCSFLFAWILMLFVVLLFAVGGLSYSMACKYVHNGIENVDTFEDVLSEGFSWNVSASFGVKNLTIAKMFKNCKDDMSIYQALHLQYLFDIDKQFNISDIEAEVNKMTDDKSFTIPDIKLMSDGLRGQLTKFKDASVTDINFTEYTTELDKKLFGGDNDLKDIVNDLYKAANLTTDPDATNLRGAADDLERLRLNQIKEIENTTTNLSKTIKSLESKIKDSVPNSIDELTDSITKSENNFNANKTGFVNQGLQNAVKSILAIIGETVNSTKSFIKYDVGKCRPLYDAAQSVVDAVCVVTLDPLNAIWFGLGWSLFFFIPCFIFAALLSNLYKRTEKYRKKLDRGFDDPIQSQYPNSYEGLRGNRGYEDNVPLTNMGKDHRYSGNGAYNPGYQGRDFEHEPRYHRDEPSGYPPDNYSRDRGVHRGSAGSHYAQPHADPYDQPPHYDDAVSERYDRVSRHGGYPRLTNY